MKLLTIIVLLNTVFSVDSVCQDSEREECLKDVDSVDITSTLGDPKKLNNYCSVMNSTVNCLKSKDCPQISSEKYEGLFQYICVTHRQDFLFYAPCPLSLRDVDYNCGSWKNCSEQVTYQKCIDTVVKVKCSACDSLWYRGYTLASLGPTSVQMQSLACPAWGAHVRNTSSECTTLNLPAPVAPVCTTEVRQACHVGDKRVNIISAGSSEDGHLKYCSVLEKKVKCFAQNGCTGDAEDIVTSLHEFVCVTNKKETREHAYCALLNEGSDCSTETDCSKLLGFKCRENNIEEACSCEAKLWWRGYQRVMNAPSYFVALESFCPQRLEYGAVAQDPQCSSTGFTGSTGSDGSQNMPGTCESECGALGDFYDQLFQVTQSTELDTVCQALLDMLTCYNTSDCDEITLSIAVKIHGYICKDYINESKAYISCSLRATNTSQCALTVLAVGEAEAEAETEVGFCSSSSVNFTMCQTEAVARQCGACAAHWYKGFSKIQAEAFVLMGQSDCPVLNEYFAMDSGCVAPTTSTTTSMPMPRDGKQSVGGHASAVRYTGVSLLLMILINCVL